MIKSKLKENYFNFLFHQYNTLMLSQKQTSVILGVSIQALYSWRQQGKGPSYTRLESSTKSCRTKIQYPLDAIADFVIANRTECAFEEVFHENS